MNSTLLLEIVDEVEKALNKDFANGFYFNPYTIKISKNSICLFLITEITSDNHNQKMSCNIIFYQEVNKSFFAEFAQFLKKISANFGLRSEIQKIMTKFSQNAELSDILESI